MGPTFRNRRAEVVASACRKANRPRLCTTRTISKSTKLGMSGEPPSSSKVSRRVEGSSIGDDYLYRIFVICNGTERLRNA